VESGEIGGENSQDKPNAHGEIPRKS